MTMNNVTELDKTKTFLFRSDETGVAWKKSPAKLIQSLFCLWNEKGGKLV